MFLDDEIVKIVLEDKPSNEQEVQKTITKVIKLCLKSLTEKMNEDLDSPLEITKQICNSWDLASKTLIKKRFPFLQVGGFKAYLLSRPDLKETLTKLGFK